MLKQHPLSHYLLLTGLILGNLVVVPIALGQDRPPQTISNRLPDQWESSDFRPPSSIGTPGSTQSGGRRNPNAACTTPGQPLPTALVPSSGFGITQEPYPQISWYMPPTTAQAVEFILFDDRNQEVYTTWYSLNNNPPPSGSQSNQSPVVFPDKGGIMSLQVPQNVGLKPLAIGQLYRWDVSLICDMNNRTRDFPTMGYIQRIAPNPVLNAQLQQAEPREQVFLYANARLWYETLATVVEIQRSQTQDLSSAANIETVWVQLLNSAGLDKIAQQGVFLGAMNTTRSN